MHASALKYYLHLIADARANVPRSSLLTVINVIRKMEASKYCASIRSGAVLHKGNPIVRGGTEKSWQRQSSGEAKHEWAIVEYAVFSPEMRRKLAMKEYT